MQAESDIFLGWTRATGPDQVSRDFYVRQLKDWKFSVPIKMMIPSGMQVYARICGWTLAQAHARSGDRIALAAYLGRTARFDQAIADFAETLQTRTSATTQSSSRLPRRAGCPSRPRSSLPVHSTTQRGHAVRPRRAHASRSRPRPPSPRSTCIATSSGV
jgi:Uncharacterized protein conserved in bacteria (DUF2252)